MKQIAPLLALVAIAIGGACSTSPERSSPLAPANSDSPAAKPGGGGDIPVTTIIDNLDASGFATDITNDGLGSYTHGVSGVTSILAANAYNGLTNGDWQFDTTSSTSRHVGESQDSDDAVQPGDPAYLVPATPPYWGTQLVPAKIEVKCTLVNQSMVRMTAGTTIVCPMASHFIFGNNTYGKAPSRSFTGFPETTDLQVACNVAGSVGCTDWFIEPIGEGRAIARLTRYATKPNQSGTHIGTFYMRFRIHVTRP